MAFGIRGLLRGGGDAGEVVRHTVGNALVLHGPDKISPEAQNLALAVVADAEHDIVVLDLGADLPTSSWESIAAALPRRRRGLRIMACGQHRGMAALVGQWLSERLNRTVVAPDGVLVRGAAGTLFVDSATGSGWVRFRKGRPPVVLGKRFPAPPWDGAITDVTPSSASGEIEPLPGGLWVRPVGDPAVLARHRNRLVADVPCTDQLMTVLVGCPGTGALHLDDIIRFWRDLAPEHRDRARFVQYGEVLLHPGRSFGQTLADVLESPVVCYSGVPVGSPYRYEIKAVRTDGVLGWEPYAIELGFAPRKAGGEAARPRVLRHRPPIIGAEQVDERVYWYAPDAVVEVVQAGLWVRPPKLPAGAGRVREVVLDAERVALFYDDTVAARTRRMKELAVDLGARLDVGARDFGVLVEASRAGEFGPAGVIGFDGASAGEGATAKIRRPVVTALDGGEWTEGATAKIHRSALAALTADTAEHPVVAPLSVAPVDVDLTWTAPVEVAGGKEIGAERAWLREDLGGAFAELAEPVERIHSENPRLQADVADSIAVRLFLGERGAAINAGLRSGAGGTHVPLGRCVLSGVARLPSHRGASIYRTTPGAADWAAYRERLAVRDRGFVSALTAPCAGLTGDTDVVIWSLAGRRTALLEPDDAFAVRDRVLFVPGTPFKVLEVAEPAAGRRGMILLREMGLNEMSDDGVVATNRVSFDEIALTSMHRSLEKWAETPPVERVGAASVDRFTGLPGLTRV
ncbi:hypothetical protein [Actinoplanes sp. L3-i22]|uniref:hypothetical protein n=1 Tax=Actinoplanes sp. L3-i22 TaxID=2836373 RepID=UPI001C75E655|nr:hypothetical protein [Actinoplanes sp. L3-i22]BCY13385.1 hypothetical protein L3i22_084730 [Actinoplanes sp. L3-i22]